MTNRNIIKINFRGGIISPGELYNILVAAIRSGIHYVSFGLRQQLLIDLPVETAAVFKNELNRLNVWYETDNDKYPNIMSSYPAEELFIHNTWLSEGVYKDIFDGMDYHPRLKINICDSNQSFTPMLTGNINWVASASISHFWHLFVRFPKTNIICEWDQLIYTNDISSVSRKIEALMYEQPALFIDNALVKGTDLFELLKAEEFISRKSEQSAVLPAFNLPYYEGLNRYNNNKYWLGIYRRDELFKIDFLKALSLLCLETKIGQLCATPWKTIIVKGIEEKDRPAWNHLLEQHQVNMRHAANELNFQVEDCSPAALATKNYLIKALNNEDTRTFGICIGIKTRRKSEVFSSILVRRRPLLRFLGLEFLHVYDILCARDFNPNERTGTVYSRNNPRFLLGEQLRRSVLSFYAQQSGRHIKKNPDNQVLKRVKPHLPETSYVYQCRHCLTVYDPKSGDSSGNIKVGTAFEALPVDYNCSLCEAPKEDLIKMDKNTLHSEPV